jgi:hypothetical protein
MPTKLDPGSDRVEACHRVAIQLKEEHGSVNAAAKALGLSQQTLNSLVTQRKLGIEFADQLAALRGTTVDGLVWLLVKDGEGAVRAGDIPGWAKAVEDARGLFGGADDLPFAAAAEVLLPIAPRLASPAFVKDLAQFLRTYAQQSQTRMRAQKALP